MKPNDQHRLLSRDEVEELYGISRRFLETVAQRGTGPCIIRVGRLVRYRPRDIERWIEANADEGNGE